MEVVEEEGVDGGEVVVEVYVVVEVEGLSGAVDVDVWVVASVSESKRGDAISQGSWGTWRGVVGGVVALGRRIVVVGVGVGGVGVVGAAGCDVFGCLWSFLKRFRRSSMSLCIFVGFLAFSSSRSASIALSIASVMDIALAGRDLGVNAGACGESVGTSHDFRRVEVAGGAWKL